MAKIRSFDVFDTLFARRYVTNDSVLRTIENRFKIENFYNARKAADTGSRSLREIYQALSEQGIIAPEEIDGFVRLEVSMEKDTIFPIQENIDKVRNGDVLISDMYMSGPDILHLVRSVGMDKQVTIYQSNAGKSSGRVWQQLKDLEFEYHIGDNKHSDFDQPSAAQIPAVHYVPTTEHTNIEKFLHSKNVQNLALLIREIRLKNHFPNHKDFINMAGQANLPFLFFACESIHRKHKGKNLVFLGRDCQLMYKIYNHYYEQAYYVPFSRKVALQQTVAAADYLISQCPKDSVLIDITSTGATWEKVCSVHPFSITVLLYSDKYHYTKTKPVLPETFGYIATNKDIPTNLMIEIFNCGDHGHLSKITSFSGIPVAEYGEPELPREIINVIHKPVKDAIESSKFYEITKELSNLSDDTIFELLAQFANIVCAKHEISDRIRENVGNFYKIEEKYLSEVKQCIV